MLWLIAAGGLGAYYLFSFAVVRASALAQAHEEVVAGRGDTRLTSGEPLRPPATRRKPARTRPVLRAS